MQELHNDLMNEAGNDNSIFNSLIDTSVKWAEYCLRNHAGKVLDSGLNISKELANYYYSLNGDDGQ